MPHKITIDAPPSKSLSHRAMLCASLAQGTSHISNLLESDDLARSIAIMQGCGAHIERSAAGEYTVTGIGGAPKGGTRDHPLSCFVQESGTTCRLVTAILAAGTGYFHIHGAGRMHDRPIGALTGALQSFGAVITHTGKPDCPPLLLEAHGLDASNLPGCSITISCDESSQYLSGLLLAAPLTQNGLTIHIGGQKAVSWPYVGLTLQSLHDFAVPFTVETVDANGFWHVTDWTTLREAVPGKIRFIVPAGKYQARHIAVEGDYSGASYFLAAGAQGPNPVHVRGLRRDSQQGDAAMLDIITRMGASIAWDNTGVTVSPAALHGVRVDMGDCPDLVPTVAALAARAQGTTHVDNVAHLRHKESDRLAAPATELRKVGCAVTITNDGLSITPPAKRSTGPIQFSSHGDHRMAMSLALLELGNDIRVCLDDPACVAKSFPSFWELWSTVCPHTNKGQAHSPQHESAQRDRS